MTREEAKEILTHNWTRVDNPNYSESELDEAFFMAIEALHTDVVDAETKAIIENVRVTMSDGDIFYFSDDAVSRDVYDKRTKADEEIIDSYREKLANCHKEILRLLDFNDITESPNDEIERQNDVIEVVRCKDCRWWNSETKGCKRNPSVEAWYETDFCKYGERQCNYFGERREE